MKYIVYGRGTRQTYHTIKQRNNTLNQENHRFFGLDFVETITSPQLGFLRGVFLANHLASTDNQNNQKTQHIPTKTKTTKRGPNKQQHNRKHATRYDRQNLV